MIVLIVPWLLALLFIIVCVLLLKKRWLLSTLLFIVVLLLNWSFESFSLSWSSNSIGLSEKKFSVLCFNIEGSSGDVYEKAVSVANLLHKYSPDIVFISEFSEQYPDVIDSVLRTNYTYSSYSHNLDFHYYYANYPLFDSHRLIDKYENIQGVYAIKTIVKGDTIDLYGCHFFSNNYNQKQERIAPEDIESKKDFVEYLRNVKTASHLRGKEAETIVEEMKKSPLPAIVLGDMNDIGGSPAVRVLERAGLEDSWWERGTGYGATIHHPLPYRIDHIMHTKGLKLETIRVLDSNGISDHDALYAEFYIAM